MRGRRMTNVSTSSISSTSSTDSPICYTADEATEKGSLLWNDDFSLTWNEKAQQHTPGRFYFITSCLLILALTSFNVCTAPSTALAFLSLNSSYSRQPHLLATLPRHPAIIPLLDSAGRERWTISIPANSTLDQDQYRSLYTAARAQAQNDRSSQPWRYAFELKSQAYMDVQEAQTLGLLPAPSGIPPNICDSSLTLKIDPHATSFGETLLLIWLSYGLARKEGRAFFLDDSQWIYGQYSSYFPPIPNPGCEQPPITQTVPYPPGARHLAVCATTAQSMLQDMLHKPSWTRGGLRSYQNEQSFSILRHGYESLFQLIGEDAVYVNERLKELRGRSNQALVAMHIRRGDRRPFERQFSGDYLPVEKYTNAAHELAKSLPNMASSLVLASDDPAFIDSPDLVAASDPYTLVRSQNRIQLATKAALDRSLPIKPMRAPGSSYAKHIDENAGWDGGFYSALFLSMGGSGQNKAGISTSLDVLRMRELIARGYLLDLAILSRTDAVACAISSSSCRLLAVMMGVDAVRDGRWVNVDDKRTWSWDGWS